MFHEFCPHFLFIRLFVISMNVQQKTIWLLTVKSFTRKNLNIFALLFIYSHFISFCISVFFCIALWCIFKRYTARFVVWLRSQFDACTLISCVGMKSIRLMWYQHDSFMGEIGFVWVEYFGKISFKYFCVLQKLNSLSFLLTKSFCFS